MSGQLITLKDRDGIYDVELTGKEDELRDNLFLQTDDSVVCNTCGGSTHWIHKGVFDEWGEACCSFCALQEV